MGQMTPDVTVITVCYNAVNDIDATLRSIVNQSASARMELVVIDGGSTDGTLDIIRRYEDKIAIMVSEPDGGIFNAMNKGIALSHGRYVNFMNAGDTFFDLNVVEEFLNFEQSCGERPDAVFGATLLSYPDGYRCQMPDIRLLPDYLGGCHQSIFTSGDLIRREKYDESYRVTADFELYHRLYLKGARFAEMKKIVAVYNFEGISSVSATRRLRYDERCRITGKKSSAIGYAIRTLRVSAGEFKRKTMARIMSWIGTGDSAFSLQSREHFHQL